MQPSPSVTEEAPAQSASGSRWPGVLFSLLIPGFGLFRANLPRRGIVWLAGVHLALVLGITLMVTDFIPWPVGCNAFLAALGVQVWALVDSYRPGRMTGRLWLVFGALVALTILCPLPGSFVARAFRIPTGGMEPAILGERSASTPDHLMVDRLCYLYSRPKRGDIIARWLQRGLAALGGAEGMEAADGSGGDGFHGPRAVEDDSGLPETPC